MPSPLTKPTPKPVFPRVREAREALRGKALELFAMYIQVIQEARAKGEVEHAIKALQWLLEHMPAGDEGETVVDAGIDKPKPVENKSSGTNIQIGLRIGGVTPETTQKALPETTSLAQVIDILPEPEGEK